MNELMNIKQPHFGIMLIYEPGLKEALVYVLYIYEL
jgi:hypothetical protein